MCSQDLNSLSLLTHLLLLLKYNTVNKYKIYWGDFVQGDFVIGGFCPKGDFVQGDFVRGDFVLIPFILPESPFLSQTHPSNNNCNINNPTLETLIQGTYQEALGFYMFHFINISKHISISVLFFKISFSCFVFFLLDFCKSLPRGAKL